MAKLPLKFWLERGEVCVESCVLFSSCVVSTRVRDTGSVVAVACITWPAEAVADADAVIDCLGLHDVHLCLGKSSVVQVAKRTHNLGTSASRSLSVRMRVRVQMRLEETLGLGKENRIRGKQIMRRKKMFDYYDS